MARPSKLKYDRGTLILHPPPKGKAWIDFATWDDRIEKFRVPAIYYRTLIEILEANSLSLIDEAKDFFPLDLTPSFEREPYPHQTEALEAWKRSGRKGVVVLPTAAGKTYLAQLAMIATPRTTLIIVPTLDLMHQWYAQMSAAFPDIEVGLLGGGSRDRTPILIATYNSAAIHAETLGNRYALQIFDECHHLPTDFFRVIAEYSISPYRLGLTATPERADGSHRDLDSLIGEVVYRKGVKELAGGTLADHEVIEIKVKLSQTERKHYDNAIQIRNNFLRKSNISLSSLNGWQIFVKASARSPAGRRAMLAHREAKEIAAGTEGKLRVLAELVCEHHQDSLLIFTNDNATVYRISQEFLIPAITHQTPVKERHDILTRFREGIYKSLVTSHVLNEGVDVPEVKVAIIISGTSSAREYVQRLGRILRKGKGKNKLATLYEIVAEDTSEERISQRRKEGTKTLKSQQLELLPSRYEMKSKKSLRAAESSKKIWGEEE
ncbi:probable DNA repair helicase [Crocosphaera subtropica ATCC 51142]|uniref:DNA 3'-5' helicase n=1 Tax=Crocosphaera subtropica (strain ATCC 51142 / BH68) TaxID=43989 RepID=B1WUD6_CROS5|nr:DEAD/DEAH box helicase family protein [Crocosphaera subtropica]ACB53790.1 probable DNA repair helicase [Crocosphaera subtropica ATCC 51142]